MDLIDLSEPHRSPRPDPALDVAAFIADRVAEHRHMGSERLARVRQLATETSENNPGVPDLAAMDQKIAFLCNDLRECFAREESMVFPALLRLRDAAGVSRCQAGAVRARLRFMVAEQEAIQLALAEASELAARHLSPDGPCESCHQLVDALESLQVELNAHLAREHDELFAWAVEREDALVRQIAD